MLGEDTFIMCAVVTSGIRRKCPGCLRFFVICKACYRGHRYCGESCSQAGRRRTFKRASKVYRSSASGRKSQNERQKRYRKNRQLKKTETQHSSEIIKISLVSRLGTTSSEKRAAKPLASFQGSGFRCSLCHQPIRWFVNSC